MRPGSYQTSSAVTCHQRQAWCHEEKMLPVRFEDSEIDEIRAQRRHEVLDRVPQIFS
jgi:hypothetical protein